MIALKLNGIMSFSLLLIALMAKFLGTKYKLRSIMLNNPLCSAILISNISKRIADESELKIDLSMIKNIFLINSVVLVIFTILYFTSSGCFLVTSNPRVQTVTLSSEGAAGELYPDSMGEYQLAEEAEREWYRHKKRDDRFLMYSNIGNTVNTGL